jgi:prepilin-type processing-associated H-X9-DG protein
MVVIGIISVLMAMLFPALNAARESGRRSECQNNLRQIGVGLNSRAGRHREFCSGAFDWRRDGSVVDFGWVADMVADEEIPVGEMLCPSNVGRLSETYHDLLNMDPSDAGDAERYTTYCIDEETLKGSTPRTLPDGSTVTNPCRKIVEDIAAPGTYPEDYSPGTEDRRALIETDVYEEHYNTNYTAGWFLVRSGVLIDDSGNLRCCSGGTARLSNRGSTNGPLKLDWLDAAPVPTTFVPLLGDGNIVTQDLTHKIGSNEVGAPLVKSFTDGPVVNPTMATPTFPAGTPREGRRGWWGLWTATLQDYRGFAPVHRGTANILFADGSVRNFKDENKDGLLNNGFNATAANFFVDDTIELPEEKVFSKWTLKESN